MLRLRVWLRDLGWRCMSGVSIRLFGPADRLYFVAIGRGNETAAINPH